MFSLALLSARPASADPCLEPGDYTPADRAELVQIFDRLSAECNATRISADTERARQIITSRFDRELANFLRAYFAGCFHNGVPRPFTEVLARWFDSTAYDGRDESFERRLQRGFALAIVDKFVAFVDEHDGVLALGRAMEGDPDTGTPPVCELRHEVLRTLRTMLKIGRKAGLVSAVIRDEVYDTLAALVDREGAAMWKHGISPDPKQFPWLGPMRAVVWRTMRNILMNALFGDRFDPEEFIADTRTITPFYAKYAELIREHRTIVTDGDIFAQDDILLHPVFGGREHDLGYRQLQIKVVEDYIEKLRREVPSTSFAVEEKFSLGNICPSEILDERCLFPSDTVDSFGQLVVECHEDGDDEDGDGNCGTCSFSGRPCSEDKDCGGTQLFGPTWDVTSRCADLQPECPYAPFPDKLNAQPDLPNVEAEVGGPRCIKLGVNIRPWLIGDRGEPNNQGEFRHDFAPLAHAPALPGRPELFRGFCHVLQHEVNHTVEGQVVKQDPALEARRDFLINRACSDENQYITAKTFCGRGKKAKCFGAPAPKPCGHPPSEFFAGNANAWFGDTLRLFRLARSRWDDGFTQPINQFLFFFDIYNQSAPLANAETELFEGTFFAQKTFSNDFFPPGDAASVCEYVEESVRFQRDDQGRISLISFGTGFSGETHLFTYTTPTSFEVNRWLVLPFAGE